MQKLPKIKIPKRIGKMHPLSSLARQHYKKPTYKHDKLMSPPWQIKTYQFAVSPERFDRALKIFDTLIKYFEKQGWPYGVVDSSTRRQKLNAVSINGKSIRFKLREKTRQTKRELSDTEQKDKAAGRWIHRENVLMPTGLFQLTIEEYCRGNVKTAFIDKPAKPIEDCLNEFIHSIIATTEYQKQRDIEWAEEEQRRQEQRDLYDYYDNLVLQEKRNIAFLFEQFENYLKIEKAREFVFAIEKHMQESGVISENQRQWITWAENLLTINNPIDLALKLSKRERVVDGLTDILQAQAISDYFATSTQHVNIRPDNEDIIRLLRERKDRPEQP